MPAPNIRTLGIPPRDDSDQCPHTPDRNLLHPAEDPVAKLMNEDGQEECKPYGKGRGDELIDAREEQDILGFVDARRFGLEDQGIINRENKED